MNTTYMQYITIDINNNKQTKSRKWKRKKKGKIGAEKEESNPIILPFSFFAHNKNMFFFSFFMKLPFA